jgi:hypothetical protein
VADLGIKDSFAADGESYENGKEIGLHLLVSSTQRTTAKALLSEGSYFNKKEPVLLTFYIAGTISSGIAYNFKVPLLKNPGTAMLATTLRVTIYRVLSSHLYPFYLMDETLHSHYYTVSYTPAATGMTITPASTTVQSSPAVTLATVNVPQWYRLTFKRDKSRPGLKAIGGMASIVDTTNFEYYFFTLIDFMLLVKKTATSVTSLAFGGTVDTQDYLTTFGFTHLRISNQSSSIQTSPIVSTNLIPPQSFTLSSLTSFSSSSISKLQG